jgi:hypothetical protein
MARFRDLQSLFRMHAASAGPCALKCPAKNAPVAQLDRAPDYESGGQEFESLRARHSVTHLRAWQSGHSGRPRPPFRGYFLSSLMRI